MKDNYFHLDSVVHELVNSKNYEIASKMIVAKAWVFIKSNARTQTNLYKQMSRLSVEVEKYCRLIEDVAEVDRFECFDDVALSPQELEIQCFAMVMACDKWLYENLNYGIVFCNYRNSIKISSVNTNFGDEFHVMPRIKDSFDEESISTKPTNLLGYLLRYHRVIPRSLYGVDIVIKDDNSSKAKSIGNMKEFSALISAYKDKRDISQMVHGEKDGDRLVFSENGGLPANRYDETLEILKEANKSQHNILIMPELATSIDILRSIKSCLLKTSLDNLKFALIGSYHHVERGKKLNSATLIDGHGYVLLRQKKMTPLKVGNVLEDLEESRDHPICLYNLGPILVGVAICFDFCNRQGPNPYDDLDLSLVFVPSLGGKTTVSAHKHKKNEYKTGKSGAVILSQEMNGLESEMEPDADTFNSYAASLVKGRVCEKKNVSMGESPLVKVLSLT